MQAASCWIGSFPEARRTLFRRFGLWAWMRSSKRPAARLGRFAACYSHACQGVKFVSEDLDFDRADSDVSVFELTIRALATQRTQNGADRSRHSAAVRLGGLLGAHTLSGKEAGIASFLPVAKMESHQCQLLLERAKELGDRLLPAFKTNSRLGGWPLVQGKELSHAAPRRLTN